MTSKDDDIEGQLDDFLRFTDRKSRLVSSVFSFRCIITRRKENSVFILVMGMTGADKSTFIQHCTGKAVQAGHGLQSCITSFLPALMI